MIGDDDATDELGAPAVDVVVPGPAVHALVIGVSRYPYARKPELKPLAGVATAAAEFAQWLRTDYSPPGLTLSYLRVLLSPVDEERARIEERYGGPHAPARRDEVELALKEWAARCDRNPDDVAVLYAAGHGAHTLLGGGFVLLEGFGRTDDLLAHALNVSQIAQQGMATRLARTNFFFVDSCRTALEKQLTHDFGTGVRLSTASEGEREHLKVCFSTAPNTKSWTLEPLGTTIFGRALRRALDGEALTDDRQGSMAVEFNELVTTVAEIVDDLGRKLVRRYGQQIGQSPQGVGTLKPVLFHRPPPTDVDFELALLPDEALATAYAELWGHRDCAWEDRLSVRPQTARVPSGWYRLVVRSNPPGPFTARNWDVLATPRSHAWEGEVSLARPR